MGLEYSVAGRSNIVINEWYKEVLTAVGDGEWIDVRTAEAVQVRVNHSDTVVATAIDVSYSPSKPTGDEDHSLVPKAAGTAGSGTTKFGFEGSNPLPTFIRPSVTTAPAANGSARFDIFVRRMG